MKKIMELTIQLIADFEKNNNFTDDSKKYVHEIAGLCEKTKLYSNLICVNENEKLQEEFWNKIKNTSPEALFSEMCYKIENAPTSLHLISSIVLLMPMIDKLLNASEEQDEHLESFKETVCDHICRYPYEVSDQDALDEICENCIVDKVKKVEVSE